MPSQKKIHCVFRDVGLPSVPQDFSSADTALLVNAAFCCLVLFASPLK